jgi:hypothetical protein
MKRECRRLWEAIVDLAAGQSNIQAREHIDSCPNCRADFERLQAMFQAMQFESPDVPQNLVANAKAIMPAKSIRMSLAKSSLQLTTARSANQDFQAIYAGEGIEVRVMYSKVDRGWEILGRMPDQVWGVEAEEIPIEVDEEGRFHFFADSLEQSRFTLYGSGAKYEIPNASEAISESGPNT